MKFFAMRSRERPKPDWDYPARKHPGPSRTYPHDSRLDVRLTWLLLSRFRNAAYKNGMTMAEAIRELMQLYIDASADGR